MSLWTCLDCTARYAVGLLKCPQCTSNRYTEEPDSTPPPAAPAPAPKLAKVPPAPPADGDGGD